MIFSIFSIFLYFCIYFILVCCKNKTKTRKIYKIIKIISFVLHFAKEYIYIFENGLSYIPENNTNAWILHSMIICFLQVTLTAHKDKGKKHTLFLKFNSLAFVLIPAFYNNLTSLIAGLVLSFFRFKDRQFCCWIDLSWITKFLKACLVDNVSRIFDF